MYIYCIKESQLKKMEKQKVLSKILFVMNGCQTKTMPFQLRLQTRRRIPRHCHPDHLLR